MRGRLSAKAAASAFQRNRGFVDAAFTFGCSQKAALEVWGSDADLFARWIAEKVTDPKLMEAPARKARSFYQGKPGQRGRSFRGC